ncbi:MAG: hypothetical protein EOM87_07705 [Clostridia bacterium]|nr:hypothetical protein [Clostridia bacterium]
MKKYMKKIIVLLIVAVMAVSSSFVFASCEPETAQAVTYLVEEDTVFVMDTAKSSIMGINFNLFLDKSSNITLKPDGTATITIKTNNNFRNLLNVALTQTAGVSIALQPFIEMAEEYIPGFTLENMTATFDLLYGSLGVMLMGFDFEDPAVTAAFIALGELGRIPENFVLPENLTLTYTSNYYIKDVYSAYSGSYSGIYFGEHASNGEPFILMNYVADDDGNKQVNLRIELVKLIINATAIE